ncbi:MAG TPA: PASTA domain-containing protein [Solirubrobacterales bacterium]
MQALMKRVRRRAVALGISALIGAGASMLLTASGAEAANVIVGSPLKADFSGLLGSIPTGTWANTAIAEPGANVTSPVSGVVVSWHMTGNYTVGRPFELRVLEPAGSGQYTGAGTSSPATPTGGMQTFAANLPIKTGDLVGLDVNEGFIGAAGVAGSHVVDWFPALPDGSTLAPPYSSNDTELGFNAEVQPQPGIEGILPNVGSIGGGLHVGVSGHDFTNVSSVMFGALPAASFTVESERNIAAVAPPSTGPGEVDVSVTTRAGTSPAVTADRFTYVACVVPKLKGRTLKSAKKKLRKAECKLGKVKGKKSKRAKVKKQKPKPGKILPSSAKVNLTLG